MKNYVFGKASKAKLETVNPLLADVCRVALLRSPYDFTIVHGWRNEDQQNALFASGASTKEWPWSTHNVMRGGQPYSSAIDFGPWIDGRIPWKETHIFACVAGCMFAAADEVGARLRWGGDWDADGNTKEHKLQDWGHMELIL